MLPWCNRIGGGVLTFDGQTYQLATTPDDGTARHGDVRTRAFEVTESTSTSVQLSLDSRTQRDVNWPWDFRAEVTYRLDGPAFIWELALTNADTRPFPAGFGHHPYFVRPAEAPVLQVPCAAQFELVDSLAVAAPVPVSQRLDFRSPRPLPAATVDEVLTGRIGSDPVRLRFPDRAVSLVFDADTIFAHWVVYAPQGWPSFAIEPMTNVNDGFALYEKGIAGSGVFVLQPGETARGTVSLTAGT
jgi:aldose 1-epimerase